MNSTSISYWIVAEKRQVLYLSTMYKRHELQLRYMTNIFSHCFERSLLSIAIEWESFMRQVRLLFEVIAPGFD